MNEKLTLLYVDDEFINLTLFEVNFKKKYNVITAMSGYEGLTKLKSNPEITIVISDMKMPGMNGVEFIKEAKKEFPKIVCFILTGYGLTEEIAKAIEDKLINKYFGKPFSMKEIDASIENAIK